MFPKSQLRPITWAVMIALSFYALALGLDGHWSLSAIPAATVPQDDADDFQSGGPESIRVVSYNIRHGKGLDGQVDLQRTAEVLRSMNADLIALQEVDRHQLRSGLQDQAKVLAEMLGMYYRFSPSIVLGFGEYGNAILSRYPIVGHERVALPGILEYRSLLKVTVQAGDRLLVFAGTHLGLKLEEREQQMPLIYEALADVHAPAIFAGDFNMGTGHSLMKELITKWVKLERAEAPPSEIDHIFALGGKAPQGVKAVSSIASDHEALVADVFLEW
jgi:endonuclease/exonuclease/phosphatase family metal-dependent hydrolase